MVKRFPLCRNQEINEKIQNSFKPWDLRKHNSNASNSEALVKKENDYSLEIYNPMKKKKMKVWWCPAI